MALSPEEVNRIREEEELRIRMRRELEARSNVPRKRDWSPGVAALLSLVLPGAGQMYKGYVGSGLLWIPLVTCGYVFLVAPGLVLHLCCILSAYYGRSKAEVRADRKNGGFF